MIEKEHEVELEIFRKQNVPEMINDSRLWNQEFLATTKHRLQLHYKNPAMDDDDVLLIIAWYDGVMIGYIGGFVDKLLTAIGYEKITWLHSWWMNPKYRFTKAGLMLFQNMYDACEGRIGISQFTPSAGRVYYRSEKFTALTQMHGAKFMIRLSFIDLIKSFNKKWVLVLIPFFAIIDGLVNLCSTIVRKLSLSFSSCPKSELLSNLDQETVDFINQTQPKQVCQRQKEFFDFLYSHRVILPTETPSVNDGRYYFSHRAKQFGYFFLKGFDDKSNMNSFLVLQVRDKVLKVLFAYYEGNAVKNCAGLINHYINNLNCHTLLLYDEAIIRELRKTRTAYIVERQKEKDILVSKEFEPIKEWDTETFNYGDGDCCFA